MSVKRLLHVLQCKSAAESRRGPEGESLCY